MPYAYPPVTGWKMAHHFINVQNSTPPFRKDGKTALFCHSSFEPRCLASINTPDCCQGVDSVFIFHSHDFLESKIYLQNHTEIVRQLGAVSTNAPVQLPIEYGVDDKLLESYQHLIIEAISRVDDIAIDISTFNRGVMIYLLDLILREKGNKPLILFYSEPEKYGTERDAKSTTWLTRDVKSINTVPGFLGDKAEQKQSLLVMLIGCDAERAIATIEMVNPDKIVLISQGALKCRKGLQELYLRNHGKILERYGENIATILTVPPHGWEAVYDVFARVHAIYRNTYNLTAVLDGTKMQVLGAVTFCQKYPSIELIYSQPKQYNCDAYTYGIGQTKWLSVPNMDRFKKR